MRQFRFLLIVKRRFPIEAFQSIARYFNSKYEIAGIILPNQDVFVDKS